MPADGFAAPIRLKDSALHRDNLALDRFTWLRANAPVAWEDEPDGRGFWSVTRHADILAVSTDPATFSSARANGGHRIFEENDVAAETVETSMISMDPPEHLEYRRMLMPGFTPARLRAMEAGIRARGAALIDRMLTKAADNDGIVDFVEDFAAPYAIQTLAELFGVSMDDGDKLFQWSNAIVAEEDPELRPSEEFTSRMVKEMVLYSFGLRAQREAAPGDDLISMLATARIDGEPISPGKFLATFILMVVAGNETTRNSLTGSVLAFADFPRALAQVKSDRALLRPCAQEIVLRLRQPRRGRLGRPLRLPPGPVPRPRGAEAPGLRDRPACVPRPAPRRTPDRGGVGAVAGARPDHRAARPRPAGAVQLHQRLEGTAGEDRVKSMLARALAWRILTPCPRLPAAASARSPSGPRRPRPCSPS
jgi:linalool 8-monooxygenase